MRPSLQRYDIQAGLSWHPGTKSMSRPCLRTIRDPAGDWLQYTDLANNPALAARVTRAIQRATKFGVTWGFDPKELAQTQARAAIGAVLGIEWSPQRS